MADFDAILTEYLAERERSGAPPDPRPYLARVGPDERAGLRARIDATLRETTRRPFDAAAFEASLSTPLMQSIATAASGSSGFWPALLPKLRNGAQLKRSEVVEQLADALGVPDRQEKVHRYYHEMEQGRLDSDGVSDTVLERLASIFGAPPPGPPAAGPAPPRPRPLTRPRHARTRSGRRLRPHRATARRRVRRTRLRFRPVSGR